MSTYQEEVLADSPLRYWRLDEVGPAANGDLLADISGNDGPATLCFASPDGTFTPYGQASGIETDPASRALYTYSDSASHVGGKRCYAYHTDSELNLTADFTLECWVKANSNLGLGGTFPFFGKRGRFMLTRAFNGVESGAANFYYSMKVTLSDASVHTVTAAIPVQNGVWYHIVAGRLGNTIFIRLNALLADSTTVTALPQATASTSPLSLTPCAPPADLLQIGGLPFNDIHNDCILDECAVYDYALSEARTRVHYETALNSLPTSATITVRAVVELDTDQVDPIDFPFAHNFAEPLSGNPRPITEHLSYATNVLQSEPDYQQRINAQPHHIERTLEYFVTPTSSRARAMLQAALWTPGQTYKLPIAKDWGPLTAQANSNDSALSLDTTLRDYEVGSYVVAFGNVYHPWTAQFFQITSRTDTELGISPNVGSILPIGSPVMPARLAILPDDDLSIESHLIDRETAALQFEILSTELSTRRLTTYTPSETYLDIEVFSLERAKVEWVDSTQYQIARRQQGVGTSTGNDFERAVDTGSPQTIPLRVLLPSRASQAEFYGWTDARQGKVNPVWIVSEDNDFNVTARSAGSVTIEYIGYASLYNVHSARRHIAFKKTDGSVVYKMITAAVDNGNGTETLSVSSPPLLADISKVSFLRLCTAPDQFELTYHRDGNDFIAECSFVMTELLATPEPV